MKTQLKNLNIQSGNISDIKPYWFLLTGILTMTFAHFTFNMDVIGWIAMVPFLIYLRLTRGWKSRVLFSFTLLVSWILVVSKIITDPIPGFIIPLYAIPITLFHLPGYLFFGAVRNHRISIIILPAVMIISEWVQYSFTPFGSWGAIAYTQVNSASISQSLSLFGMAGLGFLLYWTNASIAVSFVEGNWKKYLIWPGLLIAAIFVFGSIRYDLGKSKGTETMTVAAVGTDSDIGGLPVPSKESNEKVIMDIFDRTIVAAKAGAELVVWNEASFYLEKDYEQEWLDKISKLARSNKITIVAGYVVPISESPFRYENKFQFVNPDGSIEFEYFKHEPVAGEPAVKGMGPQRIKRISGSNVGGAICYDYDFPYLARGNNKAGADIVAIPSSDWRGIDPLHSKMAAYRAIEQGHSIIRSTRFGLSAAITPYGKMTSQMSSFDQNDKIMISHLPVRGIKTLYSTTGDITVYLSIAFLTVLLVFSIFRRRWNNK